MRIAVANKFWYRRGGLERVMFDEIVGIERAGHEVVHFSTTHPLNEGSPYQDYFAPYLELGAQSELSAAAKAVAAARMFANREAARRFSRLLDAEKPDLVHVHGIHRQLSPSILFAAKRRGIPVVQTLHDCHHVCPADVLMRGDGVVCDPRLCHTFDYSAAVKYRCVRGSLSASALSAAETGFQRLRGAYERTVTRFISPSRYLESVMRAGGWSLPIDVIPNGVAAPPVGRTTPEEFFLVATRLSPEKGIGFAAEAAAIAGVPLKIAGSGPQEQELRAKHPEAEFVGHLSAEGVASLSARARAVLVPSVVPENAPMAIIEAMILGVPVIASAIGGITELVRDDVDGVLVAPGDAQGLAAAMSRFVDDPQYGIRLGDAAAVRAATEYSFERHMERLLGVYSQVVASS